MSLLTVSYNEANTFEEIATLTSDFYADHTRAVPYSSSYFLHMCWTISITILNYNCEFVLVVKPNPEN